MEQPVKLSARVEASDGSCDPGLCSDIHDILPEPKCVQPPNYLASLDAAMSLVPEGMWHEIKGPRRYLNIPTASPNYWSARLEAWDAGAEGMGWGATPAIALCAAALKARGL